MVVAVGDTLRVPDAATVPIPWLMLTVVALVVLQLKVADWPLAIEVGDALNVAVGGTGPCAAIGQVRPLMPGRVVGVQPDGGRGRTEVFGVIDLEIVRSAMPL